MRAHWLNGRSSGPTLPSTRRDLLRLGAVGAGAAGLVGASATAGLIGSGAPTASAVPSSLGFTLLGPTRVYDSLVDGRPLGPEPVGEFGAFGLGLGLGNGGVPVTAVAVLMNVTVVNTTGAGYLAFVPGSAGDYQPGTFSHINWFGPGQIRANSVTVAVGGLGVRPGVAGTTHRPSGSGDDAGPYVTVHFEGTGVTDLVLDVPGYYQ